ncbi:NUDIX domain-containing protein [Candidatus Nomurabacteria bacterium]|nr:NUDIX domain-containing protein [Candidatus Nomurabacteria bacterium]
MSEQQHNLSHELLKIVDENTGELTGETLSRGEVISTKRWCRSTNIFVMNTKGEILCHQRSLNKERHPGWWMTHFGGHVSGEETFDDNAIKELQEEIGLSVAAEELLPWRTSRKTDARLWVRDYITIFDGDISELALQESEIQRVKWFTAEEIYAQLDREDLDEAEGWKAGTHNFEHDYHCMRAVLTAAMHMGIFSDAFHHMKNWHPVQR